MPQVKALVFNPFQENTYILYCEETMEAAIVDPGCSNEEEQNRLLDAIKRLKVKVTQILNTHGHIDHILGNEFCKTAFNVPLIGPALDKETYEAVPNYAATYGFPEFKLIPLDVELNEGDSIKIGNCQVDVLFVPGHSAGHIAFHCPTDEILISGDVIFYESIGRTDLPGGNYATLEKTIRTKIYTLPNITIIYPGHGPKTSIGYEKINNPYISA